MWKCLGAIFSGAVSYWLGNFIDARCYFEEALPLWNPSYRAVSPSPDDSHVVALIHLSRSLVCLGHLDQARLQRDEAVAEARRRRMIEDMTVRNFVVKTQTDYIRRVKSFAVFLGRSPDTATREDVRRYLLHLASSGMGAATVNGTGSALRFLFDITLDRPDIVRHGYSSGSMQVRILSRR
jgi:hypothetical protein